MINRALWYCSRRYCVKIFEKHILLCNSCHLKLIKQHNGVILFLCHWIAFAISCLITTSDTNKANVSVCTMWTSHLTHSMSSFSVWSQVSSVRQSTHTTTNNIISSEHTLKHKKYHNKLNQPFGYGVATLPLPLILIIYCFVWKCVEVCVYLPTKLNISVCVEWACTSIPVCLHLFVWTESVRKREIKE